MGGGWCRCVWLCVEEPNALVFRRCNTWSSSEPCFREIFAITWTFPILSSLPKSLKRWRLYIIQHLPTVLCVCILGLLILFVNFRYVPFSENEPCACSFVQRVLFYCGHDRCLAIPQFLTIRGPCYRLQSPMSVAPWCPYAPSWTFLGPEDVCFAGWIEPHKKCSKICCTGG